MEGVLVGNTKDVGLSLKAAFRNSNRELTAFSKAGRTVADMATVESTDREERASPRVYRPTSLPNTSTSEPTGPTWHKWTQKVKQAVDP
ncbi:hypothetical protein E2C01_054263 [Portunus trituberculatus]|uniref:Uncharacterized protein n=1 Tax=Portunus trituberculatus TaxID=210409 RepID=A0A5B7GUI9_PORTR|nr:hypothetical protein [Portunus trituberculatus]